MNDKISIVLPIYNVEAFLDKCIYSIVNQTYENIEIILVDDGSTDSSPQICDKWKQRDSRIKVIHKENGGLSDARNVGIDNATGEWIGFVDSDDYVDVTMFEKLYKACIENDCLISSCGFIRAFEDGTKNELWSTTQDMLLSQEEMIEGLYTAAVSCVAWNKLYKIELFDGVRYPFGKTREDMFTTYRLFCKTDKLKYIHEALYYYCQRKDSITGEKFNYRYLDSLEALEEALKFYKDNGYQKYYDRTFKEYVRYIAEYAVRNTKGVKEHRKINTVVIVAARKALGDCKEINQKTRMIMVAYFRPIYVRLVRTYRFLGEVRRKLRSAK